MHHAIRLLGRRTVSAVLTAAGVAATVTGAGCRGFEQDAFWRDAVACGTAAQTLAAETGVDSGLTFTAGLRHDIGRLVLVGQLREAMAQALDWARLHDMPMHLAGPAPGRGRAWALLSPALWQRLQRTPVVCARVLTVSAQGVSALAGSLPP